MTFVCAQRASGPARPRAAQKVVPPSGINDPGSQDAYIEPHHLNACTHRVTCVFWAPARARTQLSEDASERLPRFAPARDREPPNRLLFCDHGSFWPADPAFFRTAARAVRARRLSSLVVTAHSCASVRLVAQGTEAVGGGSCAACTLCAGRVRAPEPHASRGAGAGRGSPPRVSLTFALFPHPGGGRAPAAIRPGRAGARRHPAPRGALAERDGRCRWRPGRL